MKLFNTLPHPLPGQGHATRIQLTAATLLVALAGATASMAQAQPMPGAGPGPGRGPGAMHGGTYGGTYGGTQGGTYGGMHGGMYGGQMGMHGGPMVSDRMLDTVGASADQKARVRDIFKAAQDDLRKQRELGGDLHQQMMQLMTAPQVDAAAAEALRQKQLARHDVASKRLLQAMLDAQAVLTPEQRQKLGERLKSRQEMMDRHRRERQSMAVPRS